MSWINNFPPACGSTFWKSNFKQQLGCRFDIMDNISYFFVFWHMQLYMSWYIRSFFGFTFLNILYFYKYSCTSIFHRRSLYTFCRNVPLYDNTFLHLVYFCDSNSVSFLPSTLVPPLSIDVVLILSNIILDRVTSAPDCIQLRTWLSLCRQIPWSLTEHTQEKSMFLWLSIMMTSSNGNILRVTGHLCGK